MTQSYSATGVKTNIAIAPGIPITSLPQYNIYNSNHLFTILSNNNGIINWTSEVTFEGEGTGAPGKITFYGVGFERKVGNKIFYDLNGSGIQTVKGNSNGVPIEFLFSVYTREVCELCKSGNIKFNANVDATTIKALDNDKIVDLDATYSGNCEFCAKRLIQ